MYHFPFLHESCGITVDDNHIQPLYKHIINIENPTMALIGIPFNVCAFQMFDLQARFFVSTLNGTMPLPSKEQMREDTRRDVAERLSKGYTKRQLHMMGTYQRAYYGELARLADTTHIPEVIVKIREASDTRFIEDLVNFREDTYKVLDDMNFTYSYYE